MAGRAKPKLTWREIDGLEPRVYVGLSGKIPAQKRYRIASAEIGLEITKHPGMTTEELVDSLTELCADKWEEMVAYVADRVDGVEAR